MRLFKLFLVSAANAISFGMLPRKIQMSYIDIDEIPVYRSSHSQDDLFSIPTSGSTTMYELFQYSAAKFAKKNCFGQREILDTIIENKEVEKDGVKTIKEWKYLKMSEYNWYTFDEANSASIFYLT